MTTNEQQFDLVVIGSGPGGYVAAIRGAQLGLRVACIEKRKTLGGVCLNIGCIPSKALLDSTELYQEIRSQAADHGIKIGDIGMDVSVLQERRARVVQGRTRGVEYLFRKNNITWLRGTGRFVEPDRIELTDDSGSTTHVTARNVIIATGSEPIAFPNVPFDEERVLSSTGALELGEVPDHLIVIGAGAIGLELGSVWLRLGARVTVLELLPTILAEMDDEVIELAERIYRRQGFTIRTGVRVTGIERQSNGVRVALEGDEILEGDNVLVAIGRRPNTEGLGIAEIGIKTNRRGAIEVDNRYYTGVGQVYAIGDVIPGPMLAHKAEDEGVAAAENIAGGSGHVDYDAIPSVVYTAPEVAAVGKTERQLRAEGRELRIGRFPFAANARAHTLGSVEGFVKVIADAQDDRVLGIHIIGPRAADLIAEPTLAMAFQASAEDIALTTHAHPTLPETVKEAALGALGRAINI